MTSFPIATSLGAPARAKGCSGCAQQAHVRWAKELCLFQRRLSYIASVRRLLALQRRNLPRLQPSQLCQ